MKCLIISRGRILLISMYLQLKSSFNNIYYVLIANYIPLQLTFMLLNIFNWFAFIETILPPKTSADFQLTTRYWSRDSSVGIATGYGLEDHGVWEFESRLGQKFSLLHIVQTGSGVHPTSYTMNTGSSFPGVKRQRREADHSPPTSSEVKKMWIYTSTPPYVFMT
jgi:hypothetical protein